MRVSSRQRRLLYEQAGGCCEYCRTGIGHQSADFHIDHIIALKHGGETSSDNLCLSCIECNAYKGDNVAALDPVSGEPSKLFNPRQQVWDDHFRINADATISGRTTEGRVTVAVLRINDDWRVQQRRREILLGSYPCQTTPSP